MLLRFGRVLGCNALPDTLQFNKQFIYLLHLFLKSAFTFFALLTTNTKDVIISSMPQISSLFFVDDDASTTKLNFDLFSPESNIDQWTWLLEQWRNVLRTMPLALTKTGVFSRVVRTTIGIGLMHLGKCAETMVNTSHFTMNAGIMNEQLFHALQVGFYFGIAYAVVDCLQDEIHDIDRTPLRHFLAFNSDKNHPLNVSEIIDRWLSIMEQLLSGHDFDRSQLPKTPITAMLIETFDSLLILTQSTDTTCGSFNELALLLRSQRIDQKTLDAQYDGEQLYLGIFKNSFIT
ncbi:unnamed protein product [Rotaria sordida]|nr:unnamed protein product [Rotaria sordida]CAF1493554.1 unnamed protein product [Rotaria sordida]CAF1524894.1 unnamed protein product [Rotaria sordida]